MARTPTTLSHSPSSPILKRLDARDRLERNEVADVIVTDTVPQPTTGWHKKRVVSAAPVIAHAIHQFVSDGSLGRVR
jgi:phosphoribosylpyrophosphate synthetase